MADTNNIATELDELQKLYPTARIVTVQHGATSTKVPVMPLTVLQIAKITVPLRAIFAYADHGELKIEDLLLRFPMEMITIVSVAVNMPEDWYGGLQADAALELAMTVFEVNVPFFVERLAPIVARLASKLTTAANGLGNFNGSGTMDTSTPKATT